MEVSACLCHNHTICLFFAEVDCSVLFVCLFVFDQWQNQRDPCYIGLNCRSNYRGEERRGKWEKKHVARREEEMESNKEKKSNGHQREREREEGKRKWVLMFLRKHLKSNGAFFALL